MLPRPVRARLIVAAAAAGVLSGGCTPRQAGVSPELRAALAPHEQPLTLAEIDRRAAPAPAFDSLYIDPNDRDYPYSDAALVAAVRARLGRVLLRVKAPGDVPMLASGRWVRPVIPAGTARVPGAVDTAYAYRLSPVSAATVRRAARWLVGERGVLLHHYFPSMATFAAVVRPEDAPALRRAAYVSHVEPEPVVGMPGATRAVRTDSGGPPP